MVWTEIVAIIWSAMFVVSVAIVMHNQERASRLATAALMFVAGSILVLFAVALKGTL
jgi:hypothetical protein